MLQFLFDFDYECDKLRRHGTTISKDLSIKIFKAANISRHHGQLIQAAIFEINHDNIAKTINL